MGNIYFISIKQGIIIIKHYSKHVITTCYQREYMISSLFELFFFLFPVIFCIWIPVLHFHTLKCKIAKKIAFVLLVLKWLKPRCKLMPGFHMNATITEIGKKIRVLRSQRSNGNALVCYCSDRSDCDHFNRLKNSISAILAITVTEIPPNGLCFSGHTNNFISIAEFWVLQR